MRIGIYADVAVDKEPRGIGFHVINLIDALSRIDTQNEYFLYYRRGVFRENDNPFPCPTVDNFRKRPVRAPSDWAGKHPRLWWNYYLPFLVEQDRIDVFHGPNYFLPLLPRRNTVVTIHDLAFFRMNLYRVGVNAAMQHWTTLAIENAARVIALSKNTQRDLEERGVDPSRIRVIYGGGNIIPNHQLRLERCDEIRKQFGLPDKFILFVGTVHPRKNIPFLLRSFAKLKRDYELPHKLVLAGRLDSAANDVNHLIAELGISSDTVITGYVADWQVPLLYKMADLFVLPSHYEGFGMCVVEAMAYGTPVIAADTSSLHEIVGDAGLLVPVDDTSSLSNAMYRCLTDSALRAELVERSARQAAVFTWEHNARQTLAVYHEICCEQKTRRTRHDRACAV